MTLDMVSGCGAISDSMPVVENTDKHTEVAGVQVVVVLRPVMDSAAGPDRGQCVGLMFSGPT